MFLIEGGWTLRSLSASLNLGVKGQLFVVARCKGGGYCVCPGATVVSCSLTEEPEGEFWIIVWTEPDLEICQIIR